MYFCLNDFRSDLGTSLSCFQGMYIFVGVNIGKCLERMVLRDSASSEDIRGLHGKKINTGTKQF